MVFRVTTTPPSQLSFEERMIIAAKDPKLNMCKERCSYCDSDREIFYIGAHWAKAELEPALGWKPIDRAKMPLNYEIMKYSQAFMEDLVSMLKEELKDQAARARAETIREILGMLRSDEAKRFEEGPDDSDIHIQPSRYSWISWLETKLNSSETPNSLNPALKVHPECTSETENKPTTKDDNIDGQSEGSSNVRR